MSDKGKYKLNPQTLLFETEETSVGARVLWIVGFLAGSLLLTGVYLWLYTSVLGLELPRTAILKKRNAAWVSRIEQMNRQMDEYDATLDGLAMRDNEVYRNIFGMNEIPSGVRDAGFGGVNRYAHLDALEGSSLLRRTAERLDHLAKKTYVQSKSFDEVTALSRRAGEMASCIPAISPLKTDHSQFRTSSPFGYRSDPFNGTSKMHTGFDFACPPGNPIYAAGDGVVSKVSFELFGYGNSVIIDHGFGYKTRYAHMRNIYVVEGMKVSRGECIGETGKSGRATGPHLHYEVMYRDNFVNPANYMDLHMPVEEYEAMIERAAAKSSNVIIRPHTRVRYRK